MSRDLRTLALAGFTVVGAPPPAPSVRPPLASLVVLSDVIFAATGVTSGNLLNGVKRVGDKIHTQSLVMSSFDGVVRTVTSVTPVS